MTMRFSAEALLSLTILACSELVGIVMYLTPTTISSVYNALGQTYTSEQVSRFPEKIRPKFYRQPNFVYCFVSKYPHMCIFLLRGILIRFYFGRNKFKLKNVGRYIMDDVIIRHGPLIICHNVIYQKIIQSEPIRAHDFCADASAHFSVDHFTFKLFFLFFCGPNLRTSFLCAQSTEVNFHRNFVEISRFCTSTDLVKEYRLDDCTDAIFSRSFPGFAHLQRLRITRNVTGLARINRDHTTSQIFKYGFSIFMLGFDTFNIMFFGARHT